jgi:hypothetical protein
VTFYGGFRLEIGFIDYLQVVSTNHYNTVINVYALKITTAQAKSFQSVAVSTSRSLVTASNSGEFSTAPTKSSLHRFSYNWLLTTNISARTTEKTPFIAVLQPFPWERVCFWRHYGRVYLVIKNLLPNSECCFVTCFEVTALYATVYDDIMGCDAIWFAR